MHGRPTIGGRNPLPKSDTKQVHDPPETPVQFPNRCRLLAPAYDRTCLLACSFVGFLFWRQDCDARRAFRAITARLAWNLVSITNASGVPSDRQGSVHSTTPGVNEHPLGASARRDRLRPRRFVRVIASRPAIESGSGRGASGAWIDREAEIAFLGP